MYKHIDPAGWDFDEQILMPWRATQDGMLRGLDKEAMVKRSSAEIIEKFARVALEPGDYPVHQIALGATEAYGCFPAGTTVRTGSGGLAPIEELLVGDQVIDRNGRVGEISTLYSKHYTGPGTTIEVAGVLEPITATSNHGFWVIPKEQAACDIDKAKHCKPSTCQKNALCKARGCARASVTYNPEWVNIGDLRPGDYALHAIPDRGAGGLTSQNWSDAFASVLGYWLAEGSFIKSKGEKKSLKGLSFAFGFHEADTVCKDFEKAAEALGAEYKKYSLTGPYLSEERGGAVYNIRCESLALKVNAAVGEYSQHKQLHPTCFTQSPDKLLRMLASYIDGDGTCITHDRGDSEYSETRYSATTASKQLALDIQFLAAKLDLACCVQQVDFISNKTGKPATHWRVSFTNTAGEVFEGVCRKHKSVPPSQGKEHSFSWNGFICRPVRSVKHFDMDEMVYNLEVLDDHTYTVGNGCVVKNCNRNGDGFKEATLRQCHDTFVKHAYPYRNHKNKKASGDPYFGMVKASAYNEEMRRVELLTVLNGTKAAATRNGGEVADKELEALEKEGTYSVSMACRISKDLCSFCKNAAATRAEYCTSSTCKAGGCRDNLGKLVKVAGDIHHLHVDNPQPSFFDISKVWKPADRIAFASGADYLEKSASALLLEDNYAPVNVVVDSKRQQHNWNDSKERQLKLAYYLAQEEKVATRDYDSSHSARAESLPEYLLPHQKNAFLAAAAEQGIILSPEAWAKHAGYEYCPGSQGIFSLALENDGLADKIAEATHPLGDVEYSYDLGFKVKEACVHLRQDLSQLPQEHQSRVLRDQLSGDFEKKSASNTSRCSDREFAILYSQYKVAAVQRCVEVNELSPGIIESLVKTSCNSHRYA